MARPRKTLTDRLTDKINVATTSALKATAEAAAKAFGISLSCLMTQALVQFLDQEGHGKTRRSYRRGEVVDALTRVALALESLVQVVRGLSPEQGALELSVGLLRVERLLAEVARGASGPRDPTPDTDGDPE
jgi:hypothetical protein